MKTTFLIYMFFFGTIISKLNEELIDISANYKYPKKDDKNYFYVPVIGTNDLHGKIFPVRFTKPGTNENETENYYLSGGAEFIYSYAEILRNEWGENRVLWLDAGDQFQGGYEFILTNGSIMEKFYNFTKIDAMALGNHEFDFGIEYLKNFIKNSNFPYLIGNIYNKTSNKYIYEEWENVKKSIIKEIKVDDNNSIKIGKKKLILHWTYRSNK